VNEQTYTVKEFEQKFKLGHTKTYEEINCGRLATYRVGRRRFISGRAAAAWQLNLEAEANPDSGSVNVSSLQSNTRSSAQATTAVPAAAPSCDPPVPPTRRPDAKRPGRPKKAQPMPIGAEAV